MYDVLVDVAVVGRVVRREQIGRNLVKSYVHSGSGRHVALWEGSVAEVHLDDLHRRAIEGRITRPKTNRRAAAEHLLEAYAAAGVPLPATYQASR